ncbi:dada3357-c803-4ca0-9520-94aecaf79a27-CDS [Sclerotinia trifoliorum]|uniref:Dada3357-c803-4ca0-9520-94aecaf79a27-CDS n=1 Tax=Sclerotinia trifoliorum TaxID=28548 RepID=A0A8H2W6S7_9HELO|nr:dada3357-c803-4ca0-9520-94aecaf79a27-CDS [Sclerotinia trifoliorum]
MEKSKLANKFILRSPQFFLHVPLPPILTTTPIINIHQHHIMTSLPHKIYKIQWYLAFQDPLMPQTTRYHTNLFIGTFPNGSGTIYEVNGDIVSVNGMSYFQFPSPPPKSVESFYRSTLLGEVNTSDLHRVTELLKGIPAPQRQRWFNPRSMKVEACKVDGSPYVVGDDVPPFWKCTEWTNGMAIPALWENGLIKMVDGGEVVGTDMV